MYHGIENIIRVFKLRYFITDFILFLTSRLCRFELFGAFCKDQRIAIYSWQELLLIATMPIMKSVSHSWNMTPINVTLIISILETYHGNHITLSVDEIFVHIIVLLILLQLIIIFSHKYIILIYMLERCRNDIYLYPIVSVIMNTNYEFNILRNKCEGLKKLYLRCWMILDKQIIVKINTEENKALHSEVLYLIVWICESCSRV